MLKYPNARIASAAAYKLAHIDWQVGSYDQAAEGLSKALALARKAGQREIETAASTELSAFGSE